VTPSPAALLAYMDDPMPAQVDQPIREVWDMCAEHDVFFGLTPGAENFVMSRAEWAVRAIVNCLRL
jgi:hypothetical protein